MFYEADAAFVGGPSKKRGCQEAGTEKQPFLVILSTGKNNKYPRFVKIHPIKEENTVEVVKYLEKSIVMSPGRMLNTDGKACYKSLSKQIQVTAKHVNYREEDHRLHWINVIIGNFKNQILGMYHGVRKKDFPLFMHEQEYRFNHRYSGGNLLNKVQRYLFQSVPMPGKLIAGVLDQAYLHYMPKTA